MRCRKFGADCTLSVSACGRPAQPQELLHDREERCFAASPRPAELSLPSSRRSIVTEGQGGHTHIRVAEKVLATEVPRRSFDVRHRSFVGTPSSRSTFHRNCRPTSLRKRDGRGRPATSVCARRGLRQPLMVSEPSRKPHEGTRIKVGVGGTAAQLSLQPNFCWSKFLGFNSEAHTESRSAIRWGVKGIGGSFARVM